MVIGPVEPVYVLETNIRFRNMDDFEKYMNAIDVDYDTEDVTFTGFVFELITPQFNVVNQRAYAKITNSLQEVVEYRGQNCFIRISGMCFIKCINYFTDKDYKKEIQDFIKIEKYRSGVMASARIQPLCRKYNINIGCFDGKRIHPRNITRRNKSLFIHNNHFCFV